MFTFCSVWKFYLLAGSVNIDTTLFSVCQLIYFAMSSFIFPHFNLFHLFTIHSTLSLVKSEIALIIWHTIPVVAFLAQLITLIYLLLHITKTFYFSLSWLSSCTQFRMFLYPPFLDSLQLLGFAEIFQLFYITILLLYFSLQYVFSISQIYI